MAESHIIVQCIQDYLKDITYIKSLFEKKFKVDSFFEVKKMTRSGVLNQNPKILFDFHGSGCSVKMPDRSLDFDLVPENQIDVWFLWQYIKSHTSGKYPFAGSYEDFKIELQQLYHTGILKKTSEGNLYLFSPSVLESVA